MGELTDKESAGILAIFLYESEEVHCRNDFSSQWKLAEKHAGLSRRKVRGRVPKNSARSSSDGNTTKSERGWERPSDQERPF